MTKKTISESPNRLIIVSNRLPVNLKKVDGGYKSSLSSGGLVTALSGINSTNVRWFGWPSINIQDPEERKIANDALAENNAVGIFIDEELANRHYNDFCNKIIWQLLHYTSGVEFNEEAWKAYQKVNSIFADTIADFLSPGDTLWIHDYHLMLFPQYLRERLNHMGKKCPMGFTFHTPFPAEDFWKALPVQKDLLSGVLACDLVGFHTEEYKRNFVECCGRGLDARISGNNDDIEYAGRKTHTGMFIVGVDPQKFQTCLLDEHVKSRIEELEDIHKRKTVILGIDRLDVTKGLQAKFAGYAHFLKEHRDLVGRVTLLQVVVPSREDVKEYMELKKGLDTLVGEINGEYSTGDGSPIIYMHAPVSHEELTAFYRLADICLITSRRDGMNLVAEEYVACQEGKHGVLVMSEFCGAAGFMGKGSIIFNPSSQQQMSDSIYRAVTLDNKERKRMYLELKEFVLTNTSAKWGKTYLESLAKYASQ